MTLFIARFPVNKSVDLRIGSLRNVTNVAKVYYSFVKLRSPKKKGKRIDFGNEINSSEGEFNFEIDRAREEISDGENESNDDGDNGARYRLMNSYILYELVKKATYPSAI